MVLPKHWKTDILGLMIIIIIGLFVWLGNKSIDSYDIDKTDGYQIKGQKDNIVSIIKRDLKLTDHIISATPTEFTVRTFNNDVINYTYKYETIWYNETPLIKDVQSFHFEYRDMFGNLLTHFDSKYSSIETIGYLIRRANEKQKMIYKSRIEIPNRMINYTK